MLCAAPVVSAAIQNAPLSGGASLTITGLSFTSKEYASYAHQHLYASGGRSSAEAYAFEGRTNTILVTRSVSGWDQQPNTEMNDLVNGVYDDSVLYGFGALSSSTWLKFEFGSAAIVTGFKPYQQPSGWGGVWNFQGSNDDASYTTLWTGQPTSGTVSITSPQTYRYYRFIGASGNAAGPILYEIEFLVSTDLCETISWSSMSSLKCFTLAHPMYPDFIDVTVGALVGTADSLFTFDGVYLTWRIVCHDRTTNKTLFDPSSQTGCRYRRRLLNVHLCVAPHLSRTFAKHVSATASVMQRQLYQQQSRMQHTPETGQ